MSSKSKTAQKSSKINSSGAICNKSHLISDKIERTPLIWKLLVKVGILHTISHSLCIILRRSILFRANLRPQVYCTSIVFAMEQEERCIMLLRTTSLCYTTLYYFVHVVADFSRCFSRLWWSTSNDFKKTQKYFKYAFSKHFQCLSSNVGRASSF